MKNNINKYLKNCLIYPCNFLKFIRKINVKYLMNNDKNSIIDNKFIRKINVKYLMNNNKNSIIDNNII